MKRKEEVVELYNPVYPDWLIDICNRLYKHDPNSKEDGIDGISAAREIWDRFNHTNLKKVLWDYNIPYQEHNGVLMVDIMDIPENLTIEKLLELCKK